MACKQGFRITVEQNGLRHTVMQQRQQARTRCIAKTPFRGGLIRYADSIGVKGVINRLHDLEQQFGPRFAPASLLQQLDTASLSMAQADQLRDLQPGARQDHTSPAAQSITKEVTHGQA